MYIDTQNVLKHSSFLSNFHRINAVVILFSLDRCNFVHIPHEVYKSQIILVISLPVIR